MRTLRTAESHNLKAKRPHNLKTSPPHNLNLNHTMSIFSKIAAGEIPSYKCAESEDFYAFLDINPVGKAHTLVIPRKETDYLFDIEDEEYAALLLFAKRVAKAIKKAFPCKKVGMAVLGLEVAHAHIHLIPLHSEGDMDFRREKLQLSPEEMQEIADKIQAAFE